jgi:toxin ParE1/3/4
LKVRWLSKAIHDLQRAETFIADDNPEAAVRVVLRVIESVGFLGDNPAMGRTGRIEGTRELVVSGTPFIVPYRVTDGRVEILRVFHHSQKWPEGI